MLINKSLIEKPVVNKYRITADGELFIRTIEFSFTKSNIWMRNKLKPLQERKFSDEFVRDFFQRT